MTAPKPDAQPLTEKQTGPVETLCKEIGYTFDKALERPEVLVAFARILFGHVNDMVAWRIAISRGFKEAGFDTGEAMPALKAVHEMLWSNDIDAIPDKCAKLHTEILSQPDDGPCNHIIDMLSSVVSSVRFGLEIPRLSRHAASAAQHVWSHKYGVPLFDGCTSAWENDWARQQLQAAIISCYTALQSRLDEVTAERDDALNNKGLSDDLCAAWKDRAKKSEADRGTAQRQLAEANAGATKLREAKDVAYLERNQVVAALAKCFPSGVARTAIEGWSEDWHGCVYIDLPTGQVSWHFHDSHAHLFSNLPPYNGTWDGHDTPEKYRRVAALTPSAEVK